MPLGVLNNISAVYAENNLNQTQSSLQNVLTQLSSGSKINSGADDPAGLSIANGLAANSAALSQSSSNASEGAGFLQVADGALSQVTSLLTSAVTLATEAGGGTLSPSQLGAANQEYQDILTQIGTIGSTTEYNGITVFSADQTTSALGWGANAAGSATSATGASAAVANGAITAGGAAAAAAPVQAITYGAASPMTWALNGVAGSTPGTENMTLTSSVIPTGAQLSGTLAFSPSTTGGGTAASISINLATITGPAGTSLATQASNLQTAINNQAGNSNQTDYTVTVVGNNMLQIGLGSSAGTDHITGFSAAPAGNSSVTGAAAAQTGSTLSATDGGTFSGTLTFNATAAVAAGPATAVNFATPGTTVTTNIATGLNLAGSITLTSAISQAGGVPTVFSWSAPGGVNTATVASGDNLSGGITITSTGGTDPATVNVDLTGKTTANLVQTINTALGANAADYTVGYNSGTGALTIQVNGNPVSGLTAVSVANTVGGVGAATGTTPITRAAGAGPTQTIDLTNVNSTNLQSTLTADLAGTDYAANYNSGSGALTFSISAAGTTAGVASIGVQGGANVTKQTPASTSAVAGVPILLTNVDTANLASTVATALNGVKTTTADYAVTYNSGLLSVALTNYGKTTDNLVGVSTSGAVTETTPTTASIAFTDGAELSGKFTITPTVSGAAQSPITVDLTGKSTSDLVATVNAALEANSTGSSANYNVQYSAGTLTIAVNHTGLLANVDSVAIANGTSTNAMGESGVAITNINSANTVMGNFTVTPTTSAGAGSAVNVDLDGVSNANLLTTVQNALGTDYTVAYNTTAATKQLGLGNLSIYVSAAGAAAGITSFTVAEATSQAASQQTPIANGVNVYTSDGTSAGSQNYNVTVGGLTVASVGSSAAASATNLMGTQVTTSVGGVTGTGGVLSGAGAGTSLTGTKLDSQADAEAALQTVDNAINAVAYQRGQVGANINTLTAASNIASSQMTNITSAQNTITATDYASATSNMSKYEILTQTGISALAQANSTQQMVTKLLQ